MNKTEFEQVRETAVGNTMIGVHQVRGRDRTLVYGYTLERDTFHVYIQQGLLNVHIYDLDGQTLFHYFGEELPAADMRPDKRAYPERTDYNFAHLMRAVGFPITFTAFNQDKYDEYIFHTFYGLVA